MPAGLDTTGLALDLKRMGQEMQNSETARPLTGWRRAHVLSAAQFALDMAMTSPDARAGAIYLGLLEVLEPTRRSVRLHKERRAGVASASMWDRRSGLERRHADRRMSKPPGAAGGERRSGRDRRGPGRQ